MSHHSLAPEQPEPQQRPYYTSWLAAAFLLNETAKYACQWAEGRLASPSLWSPAVVHSKHLQQ